MLQPAGLENSLFPLGTQLVVGLEFPTISNCMQSIVELIKKLQVYFIYYIPTHLPSCFLKLVEMGTAAFLSCLASRYFEKKVNVNLNCYKSTAYTFMTASSKLRPSQVRMEVVVEISCVTGDRVLNF